MNNSAKKVWLQLLCSQVFPEALPILELKGEEALGRPYRFDLLLQIPENLEPSDLLNQSATLAIEMAIDETEPPINRRYHGIVTQVHFRQNTADFATAWIQLQPRLSRLALFTRTDVFTNEAPVPQLIGRLLSEAGLDTDDYELRLRGIYRSRSFVCQYRETTLDFIHRWMETLGLYYYFTQDGDREKMIICDDNFFLSTSKQTLRFRPTGGLDTSDDRYAVTAFEVERKLLPRSVRVRDYDYRRAQRGGLIADHTIVSGQVGEMMLFGENLRAGAGQTSDDVKERARLLAEAYACTAQRYLGEVAAPVCIAGDLVTLNGHPREPLNRDYRIVGLRHYAVQAGTTVDGLGGAATPRQNRYQLSWEAIDVALPFRLSRVTPHPTVAGTLTAIIDTDGSDPHAYINEYGQYKVSVPFSRTEKGPARASTWIRMASPYAGMDHGMHFPLLKGTEVLLTFVDGDPDQPVILSCVPNSQNRSMVTQANPTQNIIQSHGGNQLLMDDTPEGKGMTFYSPTGSTLFALGSKGSGGDNSGSGEDSGAAGGSEGDSAQPASGGKESFGITLYSNKGLNINVTSKEEIILGNTTDVKVGSVEGLALAASMDIRAGVSAEYTLQKKFVFREANTTKCLTASRVQLEDQEQILKKTATYLNFDMSAGVQKIDAVTGTYKFGAWDVTAATMTINATTATVTAATNLSLTGTADAAFSAGAKATINAGVDAKVSAGGNVSVSAVGTASLTGTAAVIVKSDLAGTIDGGAALTVTGKIVTVNGTIINLG